MLHTRLMGAHERWVIRVAYVSGAILLLMAEILHHLGCRKPYK